MKKLLCFAFLLFFHSTVFACQSPKIYVSPEDVQVTKEGVFFEESNIMLPIQGLFSDEKGLYIAPNYEASFCTNGWHGSTCHYCEGCFVFYCPKRCRCD